MEAEAIKLANWSAALQAYGWQGCQTVPIQENIWQVYVAGRVYALKRSGKSQIRTAFIAAALEHLEKQGYQSFAPLIMTAAGTPFWFDGNDCWLATQWLSGEKCLLEKPAHLKAASFALGCFHQAAQGLEAPGGRWGYDTWQSRFERQRDDLFCYQEKAYLRKDESPFCRLYLAAVSSQLAKAEKACLLLANSSYRELAKVGAERRAFVHRDVAGRNFVIDVTGAASLIDFDYCRYDIWASDVARLLERGLRVSHYHKETVSAIFSSYNRVRPLPPEERQVIAALLWFPQHFWRLGQRYFRHNAPAEDFYCRHLQTLLAQEPQEKFCLTFWERLTHEKR